MMSFKQFIEGKILGEETTQELTALETLDIQLEDERAAALMGKLPKPIAEESLNAHRR